MRDHLLGCAQFIPDVENEPTHFVTLRRRYPLGTPSRVYRDLGSYVVRFTEDDQQITAFETVDHTPEHMQDDFPREYDLQTMLNEAAGRRDVMAGDMSKSLYALIQEINEQAQPLWSINELVLNANRSTNKTAIEVMLQQRQPTRDEIAPWVTYAGSWDDVQRYRK